MARDNEPPVTIRALANGPYVVEGPVRIVDQDGNEFSTAGRKRISLCRCGGSVTKPFCDGTHTRIGFTAAERAVAEEEAKRRATG
jgi:CDGSH-type Zn-finger protein